MSSYCHPPRHQHRLPSRGGRPYSYTKIQGLPPSSVARTTSHGSQGEWRGEIDPRPPRAKEKAECKQTSQTRHRNKYPIQSSRQRSLTFGLTNTNVSSSRTNPAARLSRGSSLGLRHRHVPKALTNTMSSRRTARYSCQADIRWFCVCCEHHASAERKASLAVIYYSTVRGNFRVTMTTRT